MIVVKPWQLVFLALVLTVPGHAWFSTWDYRTPFYVNETAGTNYDEGRLNISVDTATLISSGKLTGDCSDLRITNSSDYPMNISIFNCDNAASTVSVKLDYLEASATNKEFYIYYGNAVSSWSNWSSTFSLWEDCNAIDSNIWKTTGTVTATGGKCILDSDTDGMIEKWNSTDRNWVAEIRLQNADTGASQYVDWGFNSWTDVLYSTTSNWGHGVAIRQGTTGDDRFGRTRNDDNTQVDYEVDSSPADGNDMLTWTFIYNATGGTYHKDGVFWYLQDDQTPITKTAGVVIAIVGSSADTQVDYLRRRRWTSSEPVYYFGSEEANVNDSLTFDWQPGTPHVEENVTFNVTVEGYNITNYWWDFDDGTDIYHNTIGNTSYIWYLGAAYNVTLIGLNASGTNVTTYNLITVTEPTIQVWVQDSVGGGMLNDFSISVWNDTNTTNFTTAGYYVEWDYHEGPRGNVTISAIKPYYNITDGAANITNASNVNVTLTADPAIVIIRARDANFPQLIVPVEVRMDNLTESRYQDSELEENLIIDGVTCTAIPCSNTSTSSEHYGQVFEYTLVATGTNTGAGDIIRAFIYIKDEGGSTQLIDWANKSASSGTETINRILYLSEAGYEVRSTGGTLIKSSTNILPGYPFRVYATLHASTDGAGETASASADIDGATTEFEFYIPAGVTLGQTDVVVSQKTTSPFGFLGTSYHYQKLSFIIYETSILNYTVYLFRASDAILQNVYIIDNNNDPVTGAYVQAFGTVNSTELISSGYTDGSGKVELPLKATQRFYIVASATGYDAESVTIYPSSSALYITLTVSTTEYTGPFTGISYSLDGQEPFQTGQAHNLTLTIADSEAGLLNFSLKVWQNITLVRNITSTSATGGVMYYEFTVPSDAYGWYTAGVEFYRTYESETYYFEANQSYIILTTGTFDELREEIGKLDALSKSMFALIGLGAGFLVGPIAGLVFGIFMFLIGLIAEGLFVLLVLGVAMAYSKEVFR